jgi:hypothetical protein
MDWIARAKDIAKLHFEVESNHPLIVDELVAEQVVYFWNNCPDKRYLIARDRQVDTIRQECAKVGMRQLAFVEHPSQGKWEGYSCLAIFEVPEEDSPTDRKKWLLRLCRKVFKSPIEQ